MNTATSPSFPNTDKALHVLLCLILLHQVCSMSVTPSLQPQIALVHKQ
jgi:hypothetical protein